MAKRTDHHRAADSGSAKEALEAIASLSYEQAFDQIEQIVEQIESGDAGLEKSLQEYERAVHLVRHCRSILAAAEQRIEMLGKDLKPLDD